MTSGAWSVLLHLEASLKPGPVGGPGWGHTASGSVYIFLVLCFPTSPVPSSLPPALTLTVESALDFLSRCMERPQAPALMSPTPPPLPSWDREDPSMLPRKVGGHPALGLVSKQLRKNS